MDDSRDEEREEEGRRETLARSEELLALFVRCARDFALFRLRLDPDHVLEGSVDYATPSFVPIVGVEDPGDYRGWIRSLCAEDRVEVEAIGARLRDGAGELDRVFRIYHRARGEWRYVRAVAAVCGHGEGGSLEVAGVLTDVTVTESAAAERLDLEARLRRTRELEALGTLASGVAHDFNNVLMAVQGHVSLALAEGGATGAVGDRLRAIEEQVRSGTKLTEQILGFARSDRQQARPTDLGHLLLRTGAAFARTCRRIEVECPAPALPCIVVVDPHKIELALLNLLVNAADAMPDGGTVRLAATVLEPESGEESGTLGAVRWVEISVDDTGIGMDRETARRIFDPFFTTKARGKGTGLGLSAVRSIVHSHGGTVRVESVRGRGTTFRIRLPASEARTEEAPASEHECVPGGTGTVLFVDDEPGNLRVVSEMLKLLGYEPLTANNGVDALRLYESRREEVDVVLLDLVMPGIGGLETFRRLRKLDPAVQVVFTTGFAQDEPLASIVRRGEASFVVKPFTLSDLGREVRGALDRRPARG